MNRVLNVILTHQPPAAVEKTLTWWSRCAPPGDVLIAFGGTEARFQTLPARPRVFVPDASLRVKDLQREKQSYGGIWRRVARWLSENPQELFTHVYFAEFDHLPLVPDLAARLLERLRAEQADVLSHHLRRIDGTSNVFYLHHVFDPAFNLFWEKVSLRADPQVVLQMHGSASFWTVEAFRAVADQPEDIRTYFEVYLPTLAHHLGFRVVDLKEQNEFVRHAASPDLTVAAALKKQSWTIHPVKILPPAPDWAREKPPA